MAIEVTEEWVRAHYARIGKAPPEELCANNAPRRRKYGNIPTERDGKTFDSRHEAECYDALMLRVRGGELLGVFCQVPFRLPGEVVYIADFVALNRDGTYSVMDAKSEATRRDKVYRLKRKLMKNCLGLEIREV